MSTGIKIIRCQAPRIKRLPFGARFQYITLSKMGAIVLQTVQSSPKLDRASSIYGRCSESGGFLMG